MLNISGCVWVVVGCAAELSVMGVGNWIVVGGLCGVFVVFGDVCCCDGSIWWTWIGTDSTLESLSLMWMVVGLMCRFGS